MPHSFAEKILGAAAGSIVFRQPDLLLTHDNTLSISKTFHQMKGGKVFNPDRLVVVLDHNAPPTSSKLATDYQSIRDFVKKQGIKKFHDAGEGICHQLISRHARPGMIIAGSDSHTCTAGAFNTFAVGIDRTEAAGIWRTGETWFRVPESMKITLRGNLPEGVYAKDLSLWIIGMLGSDGANYLSIEFHGDGVDRLSISDRMTLANLASEMGAKNAVFPPDGVLAQHFGGELPEKSLWADEGANYVHELTILLDEVYPLVAAPHQVDNIKSVPEVRGTEVHQGLLGTCTNGRIEDLRVAAEVLRGSRVADGFQLHVIPASREIYLQALKEGLLEIFIEAGANVLSSSCGPCLGTGQGIPADGTTVISTANRNFPGRMGNEKASIYLASPATVAWSSLRGKITDPRKTPCDEVFPYRVENAATFRIAEGDDRKTGNVWNYADADHLNTDQMFAGNLTYTILSSDATGILPHLFAGFDTSFAGRVQPGDILFAGENFGCGSSREHPAVGLSAAGIGAVIVKSVNRIFYRSAINQGLLLIVLPEAVDYYKPGLEVNIELHSGELRIGNKVFRFEPLPGKLQDILSSRGLVNWLRDRES
jgi:homoaconitate hydratase family protein/3-isopropylmalate dehydratase small subunit